MQFKFKGTTRLLAILLFVWPAAALADIPNGMLVFQFSGANQIYDLGNFFDCESLNVEGISVTLCLDISMVPNGKGKHTGSASLVFTGDISGTLVGPAFGSVKGKAGEAGKAKLKLSTTGQLEGLDTKLGLSCKGTVTTTGLLTSICKIKVSVEGAGSASAAAEFDDQLNGGSWTITIDVTPIDEKKFVGTATDSLGYSYAVKGKYNADKDMSNLKATGEKDTASKGAKVQLKELTDGGAADAKYKVQGYKGTSEVQTP